ncbi:hypothetical protein [Chryseobacterium herbae]|uniref:Uncharacterized protein n=1 Tax=Chryseobacterium herbae TaxID=2976476 RepID=A0ABT2J1J1_9FLAO|nr:hypothetical protein [Chryseobacterium sp. pc1-10]MCT2564710.1 hypothetical protein [Chryseobacterium sp. pc1-10]
MKKILAIIATAVASFAYSQGTMIVNNYSKFDYHGFLITSNFTTACYPRVGNDGEIVVPADSHMGNGKELMYKDFNGQFSSSLYPTANWAVTLSPTNSSIMAWNDPNLLPGGTISTTTKWFATKFDMMEAGTTISVPDFHTNMNIATPCNPVAHDNYVTPSGSNSAEIFTIGNVTYLQLY